MSSAKGIEIVATESAAGSARRYWRPERLSKIIIPAVVVLLAGIGYFAYGKYEQNRFVESLVPHVKNSSLRVVNSTRYETEEGSKISYKELFEKLESDIAEIDKRLLEVQTLSSPKTSSITDPTVEYLKASQECLRALLQKNRKELTLSSAIDWTDWTNKSIEEMDASSYYSLEFAKRTALKAMKQQDEALNEYKASLPEVITAATKLKEARERVKNIFPENALIPVGQLDAIAQKNSPKSDRTASQAK